MQALKQDRLRAGLVHFLPVTAADLREVHVGLLVYVLLMVGVLGARGAEFGLPLVPLLLLGQLTRILAGIELC